jgi:predicted glycoside hydrolase/deacetylase ChbG (UPF0249 family)
VRRLIINADDFGLSNGVTAGILEAHAAGSVTSTSMMVRCAGWEDGVRHARGTASLGVGLHFNLLVGAPLTRSPSLTDARTGRFPSFARLIARVLRRAVDRGEIVAECESQLAELRSAGVAVTHIDSHRHVHAMPVIRGAIAAVAARHGLPLRRPVESLRGMPVGLAPRVHRTLIAGSWRLCGRGAPLTRAPDHFVGVSMQGREDFRRRFAAVLDMLPGGSTEMMIHPGRVDQALTSSDAYTWQRERELEGLLSPALGERLRRGDITLIGFGAL